MNEYEFVRKCKISLYFETSNDFGVKVTQCSCVYTSCENNVVINYFIFHPHLLMLCSVLC